MDLTSWCELELLPCLGLYWSIIGMNSLNWKDSG
jgi:hypothetical protein